MQVNPVSNNYNSGMDAIAAIQSSLNSIAKRAGVSVDQLVDDAKNAENPTPTQTRVLNLTHRLEKLEG